jgi:hypothetical protein
VTLPQQSVMAPQWEEITRDEYFQAIEQAGGYDALSVFSSLTDPDGVYSGGRIYTAWAIRGADVPLVDACKERPLSDPIYEPSNWQTWPETYRRFIGTEWD